MKIWIDTDIGDDIDDALALLLAMASPELEIAGVSTVFGAVDKRAQIAKALLAMGGYEHVPVYAGCVKPVKQRAVFYEKVDGARVPKTYLPEVFSRYAYAHGAVEALRDALLASDDGLTVVTIGALTNIARLLGKYPQAAKKIKRLHIMGTAVGLNLNEFNITCDPEAAAVVLNSAIQKKVVGLDVTFQCTLSDAQRERLFACSSECVKTVMEMSRRWSHGMVLHDPLALASAFTQEFLTFVPGNLFVCRKGKYARGKCVDLTDFNWHVPPREDLSTASKVDAKKFTDFYVERICAFDRKIRG